MTQKKIFLYRLFYVKTATSPEKGHPPLSQQPPIKIEILPSSLFENLVGRSIPLAEKGVQTMDILVIFRGNEKKL